jgi:hypothetical protein
MGFEKKRGKGVSFSHRHIYTHESDYNVDKMVVDTFVRVIKSWTLSWSA